MKLSEKGAFKTNLSLWRTALGWWVYFYKQGMTGGIFRRKVL